MWAMHASVRFAVLSHVVIIEQKMCFEFSMETVSHLWEIRNLFLFSRLQLSFFFTLVSDC